MRAYSRQSSWLRSGKMRQLSFERYESAARWNRGWVQLLLGLVIVLILTLGSMPERAGGVIDASQVAVAFHDLSSDHREPLRDTRPTERATSTRSLSGSEGR